MATKKSKAIQKIFSDEDKNKLVEKLVVARIALLLRHPFFGNLATRLNLIDATDVMPNLATLATDGRNFFYSNEFVDRCTPKNLMFGFAHEIMHNVFDHMGRRGTRDPLLSNIAADYASNQICKDESIGDVPPWIKIYQDDMYRDMAYEEIYDSFGSKGKGKSINSLSELGELFDEHIDQSMSEEERKALREEMIDAVISAAQAAGAGNVPKGIQRMISLFTEPKMDWRAVLRMNIQSLVRSNFTFSRPNRKSQHSGAILPGMTVEEAVIVTVAIDMSGSISNEQASEFIAEVKGLMQEYAEFELDIFCFDCSVHNYAKFNNYNAHDIDDYEVKGGGGTSFEACFDFMKEREIVPKKFVMITDGYPNNSWGDAEYCDTLFIIHGNDKIIPPFGDVAYF